MADGVDRSRCYDRSLRTATHCNLFAHRAQSTNTRRRSPLACRNPRNSSETPQGEGTHPVNRVRSPSSSGHHNFILSVLGWGLTPTSRSLSYPQSSRPQTDGSHVITSCRARAIRCASSPLSDPVYSSPRSPNKHVMAAHYRSFAM